MSGQRSLLFVVFICILATNGCSHSNNLLFGEVRAQLGTHEVLVTDCYRTRVPQPITSKTVFRWQPCRDAVIAIENKQLTVNGKHYGDLSDGDSVVVDHGVVSVGRKGAEAHTGN